MRYRRFSCWRRIVTFDFPRYWCKSGAADVPPVLPVEVHELWDEAFCADHNFRGKDYVDTCGLTDLYILNPLLTTKTDSYDRDRHPVYYAPFGNPEKVTVHAYAGTAVEALAKEMGYRFVPLPEQ